MKIILIINGYPRSGKDTFAGYMADNFLDYGIYTDIISSVSNVKEAAEILGWDGTKSEHNRNALSDLKDLSTKYWDGPFNMMSADVDDMNENECVIFMVREPREIQRFVNKYPTTMTVFIKRDDCEKAGNHADSNVENFIYDCYIENKGLRNLLEEARILTKEIMNYAGIGQGKI